MHLGADESASSDDCGSETEADHRCRSGPDGPVNAEIADGLAWRDRHPREGKECAIPRREPNWTQDITNQVLLDFRLTFAVALVLSWLFRAPALTARSREDRDSEPAHDARELDNNGVRRSRLLDRCPTEDDGKDQIDDAIH